MKKETAIIFTLKKVAANGKAACVLYRGEHGEKERDETGEKERENVKKCLG